MGDWEKWLTDEAVRRDAAGLTRRLRPRGPDDDVIAATEAALAAGVWLRPFRDLVYTMPPYICTDDEIDTICAAMIAATKAST